LEELEEDLHLPARAPEPTALGVGVRLGLSPGAIDEMLENVAAAQPEWDCLITANFLPEALQGSYRELLRGRRERLAGLR